LNPPRSDTSAESPIASILWQQLFLIAHFGANTARLGPLQIFPWNWTATLSCALLSFYLVEQPLIRLGHRLAPTVATNT
jgi:hypothetical protein